MDPTVGFNPVEWLKLGVEFTGVIVMLWTIVIQMPKREGVMIEESKRRESAFLGELAAQRTSAIGALDRLSGSFREEMGEEHRRHEKEIERLAVAIESRADRRSRG